MPVTGRCVCFNGLAKRRCVQHGVGRMSPQHYRRCQAGRRQYELAPQAYDRSLQAKDPKHLDSPDRLHKNPTAFAEVRVRGMA